MHSPSRLAAVAILAFARAPLSGATIQVSPQVQPYRLVEYTLNPPSKNCVHWVLKDDQDVYVRVDSGDPSNACFTGPPGRYTILVAVMGDDGKLTQARASVQIGDIVPEPPGPGPNPPMPPGPTPPRVGPAKVLLLFESETLKSLTAAENDVLFNKDIRTYLSKHVTVTGNRFDGKIYDKDTKQLEADGADWKKAATEAKPDKFPWLVIFDDKGTRFSGYVGDVATTMKTLTLHLEGKAWAPDAKAPQEPATDNHPSE